MFAKRTAAGEMFPHKLLVYDYYGSCVSRVRIVEEPAFAQRNAHSLEVSCRYFTVVGVVVFRGIGPGNPHAIVSASFQRQACGNDPGGFDARQRLEPLNQRAVESIDFRGRIVFGSDQPVLHGKYGPRIESGIGVEQF
jgi:hypothetical protein